ncbi:MAG: YbgC/FadM family acyl-CoA thioesterase [Sphingomonas fennica]
MTGRPDAGRLADGAHLLPVRVYYEDTDAGGVAYHATYLRWMERGRSELLAALGIDQQAALADGTGHYVVADLAIRYRLPARLQDALVVESRPVTAAAASALIHQTVRRGDEVLATAEVRVAFVSGGRPARQPAAWRERFAGLIAG